MDIQKTLTKLNKIMTDAQIADVVGASQSIITRLRNGNHKSTSFERGQAIKKLALNKGIAV